MTLEEFFELDSISSVNAITLNMKLSEKNASDIPIDYREIVISYLLNALNMNTVNMNSIDPNVLIKLDNLLSELQEID